MTMAFQIGLLCHEISGDEAIEAVGIDWVELAQGQHKAIMEDLAWALRK